MPSMPELSFWLGGLRWNTLSTKCFIFVTGKEQNFPTNENIALLHLKRKKIKTSFIWSHTGILWSIVSIVEILLSKNKMHLCHANWRLLRNHCLVSTHNTLYFPFERENVVGRDQIKVTKEATFTAIPLTERKSKLFVYS